MSLHSLSRMHSYTGNTHGSHATAAQRSGLQLASRATGHVSEGSTGQPLVGEDSGLLHIAGEGVAWGESPRCNIPHI